MSSKYQKHCSKKTKSIQEVSLEYLVFEVVIIQPYWRLLVTYKI